MNMNMNQDKNIFIPLIIGTYNLPGEAGLFSFLFNQETGDFLPGNSAYIDNPSFFTFNPKGNVIYTFSEKDVTNSQIYMLAFDKTNANFKEVAEKVLSGSPCYISFSDKRIVVANYGGGTVDIINLNDNGYFTDEFTVFTGKSGAIDSKRQQNPHVHCAIFKPNTIINNNEIFITDFSADKLVHLAIIDTSAPPVIKQELQLPLETGPRHLVFDKKGKFAYLIGELSGKIAVIENTGFELQIKQIVSADLANGRASADIHISPDGKFLYASHRNDNDGISIFSIDLRTGLLKRIGFQPTAKHPRNFTITPNGKFILVACRDENIVEIYQRDYISGLLSRVESSISLVNPVCVKFYYSSEAANSIR